MLTLGCGGRGFVGVAAPADGPPAPLAGQVGAGPEQAGLTGGNHTVI